MVKEKAKDPSTMTIEERLKNLYRLQTTLSEVDQLEILRGELPQEVEDLEDEIEGLCTRIAKIQDDMVALKREVADRRAAIEEARMKIAKYEEQSDNVENNRVYDALQKEIREEQLGITLGEKRMAEASERLNERAEAAARYNEQVTERRLDLERKKAELDDIVADTREQVTRKRNEAARLEGTIEPHLLNAFKRIRGNCRNGLGIVCVQRDACGGCFNKIPPQRQLDVRMYKKVIVCEYCGRILIDPQLAGVEAEVVEKPKRKRATRAKKAAAEAPAEEQA